MPHHFSTKPCANCGYELKKHGKIDLENTSCPDCGSLLKFKWAYRFFLGFPDYASSGYSPPPIGSKMEARIKGNGELEIPDLPLDETSITHDIPSRLCMHHRYFQIELLDIQLFPPEERIYSWTGHRIIKSLDFRFIKEVHPQLPRSKVSVEEIIRMMKSA